MKHILALDQGTTSSRAILFDHAGSSVAVAQKEFPQIFPKPGWVEHNPRDIWSTQMGVAAEVLTKAHVNPADVAAIGITNQRETTVVWDRATGQPIHNAIVWQDTRADQICRDLAGDEGPARFQARTGLRLATYCAGPKARWILDEGEGGRARAGKRVPGLG